jgi:hypothetical protein
MMGPIPSALGAYRRKAGRWTLFGGLALCLLTLCTGCGEVCLFCDGSDDAQDPCSPDPCAGVTNATAGTCTPVGESDYSCDCVEDFFWDGDDNECVDPCDPDPCAGITNATADTCTAQGADDYTCECGEGFIWDDGSDSCEEDPCDPDPCAGITNATAGTCTAQGADDYTCECIEGFIWDDGSDSCEEDPCDPDPCADVANAVGGTCTAQGADDYTCECDPGYTWDSGSNDCTGEAVGTCEDLEQCLMGCSWNDFSCPLACQSQWTGCECEFDFENPPIACGFSCLSQVADPASQAYYDCVVECFFDTECQ